MTANLMPRVTPYLFYEDVAGALTWLGEAFGFRERMRMPGPDGRIRHAEMDVATDGVILMGCPGPEYRSPKRLGARTQTLYVKVDDLDTHCARARAAAAVIIEEPADQDYGDRRYAAEDPEGHRWYFAQPLHKSG
jgi:PhnB protein